MSTTLWFIIVGGSLVALLFCFAVIAAIGGVGTADGTFTVRGPKGRAIARLGHSDQHGHCYVIEVRIKRAPPTTVYAPPSVRIARLKMERLLSEGDTQ